MNLKGKETDLKKLDEILGKLFFGEDFLVKINGILENSEEKNGKIDFTDFFSKINTLKKNGKNIFRKYGNDEESKKKIITYIINEINLLFKNLNIRNIYSYGSKISMSDFADLSFSNMLKKIKYSKNHDINKQEAIGWNCNNLIIFLYKVLYEDIIGEDKEIDVKFQINGNTHGKLFFKFNKELISLEEDKGLIKLKTINRKKYDFKKYFVYIGAKFNLNYEDYLNIIDDKIYNKKKLVFIYDNNKIIFYNLPGGRLLIGYGKNKKVLTKDFIQKDIKYFGKKMESFEKIEDILHKICNNDFFEKLFFEKIDKDKLKKIIYNC